MRGTLKRIGLRIDVNGLMKKDKIREHLGKHLHELSSGDLHILYSMLVGF